MNINDPCVSLCFLAPRMVTTVHDMDNISLELEEAIKRRSEQMMQTHVTERNNKPETLNEQL